MKSLIKNGLNLNANDPIIDDFGIEITSISENVILNGSAQTLKLLIDNGLDVNKSPHYWLPPLCALLEHFAFSKSCTNDNGELNEEGKIEASRYNDKIEVMLEGGADINWNVGTSSLIELVLNIPFVMLNKTLKVLYKHGADYSKKILYDRGFNIVARITPIGYLEDMIKHIGDSDPPRYESDEIRRNFNIKILKEAIELIKVLNKSIRTLKNIIILNIMRKSKVNIPPHYPKLLLKLDDVNI